MGSLVHSRTPDPIVQGTNLGGAGVGNVEGESYDQKVKSQVWTRPRPDPLSVPEGRSRREGSLCTARPWVSQRWTVVPEDDDDLPVGCPVHDPRWSTGRTIPVTPVHHQVGALSEWKCNHCALGSCKE